ncbi:PLP-dependent aspartate aminotransferase family protein [Paenibacillus sp. S150]|uniref:trans-sulfuration enzyme family protein n=1 Tax=Paenibacillus sp. S150 TaxID=2749826 RepID=UPI001C596739|nr:aminotransferase class I/II-fold pyridoxal phosphate-dependent enzyme [Paenibacillus sp. S150]MBW4082699.1 aminotransferase class I/II-fold pyridoxal phosphate-dependent enzyme [Paenibacillus sp. S150]
MAHANWSFDTLAVHGCHQPDERTRAVSQPIIPAVAYAFPDTDTAAEVVAGQREGAYYGRYGNPTTQTLERKIAELEGGEECIGLSSGMAAISAALLAYLQAGDHVLVTRDVYGGTYNFVALTAPRFGITHSFVDCTNLEAVAAAVQPNTKALFVETPSNPLLTVLDLRALAGLAHSRGLPLIVDSTFMTPCLQKPLELGADLVVHSATKYINGHGDVVAGLVVGCKRIIDFIRKRITGDLGQNLNAWEAFLILRGLKTMGLRVRTHCGNAQRIAEYLQNHPSVSKVHYPGLAGHPQHHLAKAQMKGMGGIVSFEVEGGLAAGKKFMDSLKLAMISFSLGDPETLVQHPATMTHYSIPAADRLKFGITDGLIRMSVGLEDAGDIIADLEQALGQLQHKEEHAHGSKTG